MYVCPPRRIKIGKDKRKLDIASVSVYGNSRMKRRTIAASVAFLAEAGPTSEGWKAESA